MSLNLFIAVACVVAAILLTIATVRFFFSARKPQVQDAFKDQPAGEHASAGETRGSSCSACGAAVHPSRRCGSARHCRT